MLIAQSGVLTVVGWVLTILIVLLVIRVVLSWFPAGGPLLEGINRIATDSTEWMLAPIRRVMPPLQLGGMALDLSFTVVLLVLILVRGAIA